MGRWDTGKVLAATTLGTMDTNALVPIIALYASYRGADLLQVGLIVGLYSAVHAPANLLFGRLADRWGRVRPLRLGLLWDALSMVLYAAATDPLTLALARVSHGVGGGLVGPSTMALTSDRATAKRYGRTMAWYGISIAAAVIAGTGMAGPVVSWAGFSGLFALLAIGLLSGFALSIFLEEAPRPERERPPWREVFAHAARHGPRAGYASIFTLYFLLGAFTALVPLYLRDELGYGALQVGLSFTIFAVLSLAFHYPAGILTDRFGAEMPALIGLVATSTAMAVLPAARDVPSILLVIALFGMGHGFVFPSSSALVTRDAKPANRGLVTGLFYSLLVAGVAVGAPAMAAVADAVRSYGFGLWASAWFGLFGIAFLSPAIRSRSSSRATLQAASEPRTTDGR